MKPGVVIVGGGLAGMVSALRLLERGFSVEIYEASARLGGKAGAGVGADAHDDHGYHIFPAWYRNIWQLVDELGILDQFVDCFEFWQMPPGHWPTAHSFRNLTAMRYAWHNLRSGALPAPQAFLFFYAALDLMSQPYSYRATLDRVTVSGFLRARPYRTEQVSSQFEELMLKGISVPTYQVSAMTMRNVMRYWCRYPEPMMRICNGSLYDRWITPLQQRIEKLGAVIHTGHRLERLELAAGVLAKLHLRTTDGAARDLAVDQARTILAVPCEKVWPLLDDELIAAAPELARTRYLRSTPMAAMNLYLDKRIDGMPRGHVNLLDSNYGLSFLDVSNYWPNEPGAALQLIASNYTGLLDATPEYAQRCLMQDLVRYVPALSTAKVVRSSFFTHHDEPLFMNDVGAWTYRPDAATSIPNLFVAGDYCRSAIDLVSMEGAVSTGLLAAEAVRADAKLGAPIEIRVPETPPRWLLVLGRLALLPLALLTRLWLAVTGGAGEPPDEPAEPMPVPEPKRTGIAPAAPAAAAPPPTIEAGPTATEAAGGPPPKRRKPPKHHPAARPT